MNWARFAFASLLAILAVGGARADQDAPKFDAQWRAYKQRFIADEGRLVDDFAGNVSHSEGQGYAMLLAAYANDRASFDKLWAWTKANLDIRDDPLASWRWRPEDEPHVLDHNNATDGDLLIAWALAVAGERWRVKDYDASSAKIARAIGAKLIIPTVFGPALLPGLNGFGAADRPDGPIVNLSYWVFPAFDAIKRVAPEVDWGGVKRSGLSILDAARFGPKKLPSDWISLKYGVRPADGFPVRFGYDVVRAPLYLAWGAPQEKGRLGALVDAWAGPDDTPPQVIDLDTGAGVETLAGPGYRAVAALARCVAHGVGFPDELKIVDLQYYYPATLQMLSLVALREGGFKC